jgi:GAF domain-containing protein
MVAERTRLAVLGEDTINFQNHYRHRDGSCRWLEWMIRPDASTSSLYAIARDITTGKEAEDSLQLLVEQLAIIQRAIAERSRLDEILDTIVQAVVKVLGREIAGLRLIDENDPSYVVLAASTRLDEKATRILRRGPVTDGIAGRATVEERLLISNDYGSGEAEIQMLATYGLRAATAAPVYGHGAVVGSLVIATTTEHRFSEAEAGTLAFFAEYAGVALSAARAADAVRQALTDPLTGLPNRALFLDRLDHAVARAERAFGEVSVLFLDVDEFKPVNDSLGHLAGDQLLIEIAKRIRNACAARTPPPGSGATSSRSSCQTRRIHRAGAPRRAHHRGTFGTVLHRRSRTARPREPRYRHRP